jgi:hypothetical protein
VLTNLDWFPDLSGSMAHFRLGVQEIKKPRFVDAGVGLAAQVAYHPV